MATILTVAFAFGMAIYAFEDDIMLVAAVILFYLIIQLLIDKHRKHKYLNETVIYYAGQIYNLRGYIDSGNGLIDPKSNAPVCIISLPVFLDIFPDISADKILLNQLNNEIPNGYYIDYKTISGNGKIFVFKPDKFRVGGIVINNVRLGVSSKNFGNLKYDALLNAKIGGML